MVQQRFRIFTYNPEKPAQIGLAQTLEDYIGLDNLAALSIIQAYDLCVQDSSAEAVHQFCGRCLADPVCDRYLLEEFVDGRAGKQSNTWQQLLWQANGEVKTALQYLSYETLAAQFDPRAQAVQDCWRLWCGGGGLEKLGCEGSKNWNGYESCGQLEGVRCFWLYVLHPKHGTLDQSSLAAIHQYLWTPLEFEVKNLNQFSYSFDSSQSAAAMAAADVVLPSLLAVDPVASELRVWADQVGLRFDDETLAYIYAYYSGAKLPGVQPIAQCREPSLSELRILEAYWSDHCRHTTFHTVLDWQDTAVLAGEQEGRLPEDLCQAWRLYQKLREQCQVENKAQSLMDIAVLGARAMKALGGGTYMENVEFSKEVNACSVFVNVEDASGGNQRRLLMFKNETHNHPTEIAPYGGAATCLGGAIRDPLSGRSFVYQGLRLSAAAAPNQSLADLRPGKLPQRKIAVDAARGFSDYGNCIGLACNMVWEYYDPGFEAKHFECGVVVGTARPEQVQRLEPQDGDLILLLGGATGRDGIGGASGSSKAHDSSTLGENGAEVQRGNPIEERKLQRFFRRSDVGYMIKRCNDLGAGGAAVAVGEIADGLEIDLAVMPTKYHGLRADELAVSESQERMALVIDSGDWEFFCERAEAESIAVVQLGRVTKKPYFLLRYGAEQVASLARDFLDSSGFARRATVRFSSKYLRPYRIGGARKDGAEQLAWQEPQEVLLQILSQPQVASQRGLQHMFDSSVGASTVFQPYPQQLGSSAPTYGRSEISAQLIPLHYWGQKSQGESKQAGKIEGYGQRESHRASLLGYAYDPQLSRHNTFLAAQVAVLQSAAKLIAAGAKRSDTYLSLQEYFPRLESSELWGQAAAALLGALQAQHALGLAAIGGKDSMSGTFEELQVPPVLSAFAFSTAPLSALRPANWQKEARYLYLLGQPQQSVIELHKPDYQRLQDYWQYLESLVCLEAIQFSARLIGVEGILGAIALFAFGSSPMHIHLQSYDESFLEPYAADSSFGATLIASSQPLSAGPYLQLLAELEPALSSVLELPLDGGAVRIALDAESEVYCAWTRYEQSSAYYPTDSRVQRQPNYQQQQLLREALNKQPLQASSYRSRCQSLRIVVPVFPGSNSEDDMLRSFAMAAEFLRKQGQNVKLELCSPVINLLNDTYMQDSLEQLAELLAKAQILALPGGFSASDEPDGSAKFIAAVLRKKQVARAIDYMLGQDALILGICNGFQALIKTGLLPYGRDWQEGLVYGRNGLSISHNRQGRHIADLELCRVCPTQSPWLQGMSGKDYLLPVSHGEGRLIMPEAVFTQLQAGKQIAAVYHCDINGSYAGIEALCSQDGRILGKMSHSERRGEALYRNIPYNPEQCSLQQDIFSNGLRYFLQA